MQPKGMRPNRSHFLSRKKIAKCFYLLQFSDEG